MTWKIKLSSRAEKYYNKLDMDIKGRVKKELMHLNDFHSPIEHQQVRRLTGELNGFYRLKVGSYRIIFAVLKENNTIAVVNIAPRGDVYK